ncbi:MAG: hypothetical protein R3C05_17845 [Pirellulaceae bacterium]
MHRLQWVLVRLWASPYTLLGMMIGILLRGKVNHVDGVIEIHGVGVAWVLKRLPVAAIAITLGHCVLGQTQQGLDITRRHERVHVKQYERWGFAMGIAYLTASAWMWLRGKDAYRDNPFEVEAFSVDDLE